jgi:LacI family transcriptional regulator
MDKGVAAGVSAPKHAARSIRDVAARAGVSIATVSRVVNGSADGVTPALRARVQAVIDELEYRPNRIGRALRTRQSGAVALVVSNIQNTFYAALAWELERRLIEAGQVLMLFNSNESAELQDRCFQEIATRDIGGLLLLCAVESRLLDAMVERNRTVFINRRIPRLAGTSFVGIDDEAAARDLAHAMLRAGRGPVGLIHGPLYSATSAARLRGLLDVLAAAGATPVPGVIAEAGLSMEDGYRAAATLLEGTRCAALYCGNDQIAYGAHRRCLELGLRVPQDVRIFGFDDNPLNDFLAPWLNTVRVPHADFAAEAVLQWQALAAGGPHRDIVLPYELVLRG